MVANDVPQPLPVQTPDVTIRDYVTVESGAETLAQSIHN